MAHGAKGAQARAGSREGGRRVLKIFWTAQCSVNSDPKTVSRPNSGAIKISIALNLWQSDSRLNYMVK